MATKPAPKHWTYAEFARLPDDGKRYEIIAGDLVVSPTPHYRHQLASVRIIGIFEKFTREHGIGQLYGPVDVLLSGTDYLVPDLVFLKHERRGEILSDRGFEGPPDLAIEIVSSSSSFRDRGVKRERYALFGVPLYWVVDIELRQIEVYRLADDPNRPPEIVADTLVWHPIPGGPALTLSVPFVVDDQGDDY